MLRVSCHLGKQPPQPVDDGVGQIFIQSRPAQDLTRAIMHHLADKVVIGLQRAIGPMDDAVHHGRMAAIAHCRLDRLADQRRNVHAAQPLCDRALDHAAKPFLIKRLQHVRHQPRRAFAQAAVAP